MSSLYDFYMTSAISGAIADERLWAMATSQVANLKSSGWITLGSSILSDSAVAQKSVTPDGVDWWAGRGYLEGFGGGLVWHVLRSPSGVELSMTAEPGGGNAKIFWFFSLNGFTTAGIGSTWRGLDGTTTRPNDIASTPASGREFGQRLYAFAGGAGNGIAPMVVRKDGNGFIWHFRPNSISDMWDGAFASFHKLTKPAVGDDNPFIMVDLASLADSAIKPSSAGIGVSFGRIGSNIVHHCTVELGGVTTTVYVEADANPPDLSFGNELIYPMAVYSDELGGVVRWTLADVYRIRSRDTTFTKIPYGTTFNNGTLMVVGKWVIPWNHPQSDNPAIIQPFSAFPPPQGAGMGFLKAFNLGMEVL